MTLEKNSFYISSVPTSIREGGAFEVEITRTGTLRGAVLIHVGRVWNGSDAKAWDFYRRDYERVLFLHRQSKATITLRTKGDDIEEGNEIAMIGFRGDSFSPWEAKSNEYNSYGPSVPITITEKDDFTGSASDKSNEIKTGDTISDLSLNFGELYQIDEIRDFDGYFHGGAGNEAADKYKYQGEADLQGDGRMEQIFTNSESGRWASIADEAHGKVNLEKYRSLGCTRVLGIYTDPFVEEGLVEYGSEFDSQTRFSNDIYTDNLQLGASDDVDRDGLSEVFWKTTDGSAYLRSIHHLDGNIKYANYMNAGQMTDYLSQHGHMGDIGSSLGL